MAGMQQQGDGSQTSATMTDAASASVNNYNSNKLEEPDHSSSNWYFPREYIEKSSPSRKDGIDLKKETYFRKSYCTFLQDLGMRLKVPQVTIATAIVFCHRFFLRQSHSSNDRYLIATTCMFLAGKVEETPQKLCDVIFISYEIRNKKDPNAVQRIIKQKDVYEQQKELVLLGERLVLATLGFDLNIHHPYKPLVAAIKKFKVAQNALAQVAWNFVNDGLRTSLCLQFKPHHIAAGAIFLAAKFLKVKLPNEGEKVWWQEFDVTPRQLEEVSNQMLELYEQNREAPASRVSDPSVSVGASNHNRPSSEVPSDSPMQHSEKKVNPNSHKRSVTEAFPSSTDISKGENDDHFQGESKPRSLDDQVDPETPHTSTAFETATEDESNTKIGVNANMKPSADAIQATDTKSRASLCSVKDENSAGESLDRTGDAQSIDEVSRSTDTKAATAVEDGASKRSNHGQPKSEFVDLADVNIDRVKAAIQRRKMESKAFIRKRELTDEEELLEMDLENGRKDVKNERSKAFIRKRELTDEEELLEMDLDNGRKEIKSERSKAYIRKRELTDEEELLEMDMDNGRKEVKSERVTESNYRETERSDGSQEFEGKQHVAKELDNGGEGKYPHGQNRHNHHHHQQKLDSEMERHQRGDAERQERDYKKPRLDYRK